ncbi:hypothetical protein HYH02_010544 [Chlamydomonas schloesseri]|uniref:Nucleotide-diphospho-sugar transferase domain-containing protein n=1 Tax=Chlamydomonas schloesseri TaxID=2026947 RepID=A0A835W5A3_9CHLO|nr:hypothetical protein HYH02_010544 [Chlamydomonas schloesseri]|eukprot:KAG2439915.1 hypothetical protein HYH02_010544 [Chlamydomonas schloesseri]
MSRTHPQGFRIKALPALITIACGILLVLIYTSYHQQHRLSQSLHAVQHGRSDLALGLDSSSSSLSSSSSRHAPPDWHAVWRAAKAASSEHEFISAMAHSVQGGGADNALSTGAGVAPACPPQRDCPACLPATAAAAGATGQLPHTLKQRPQHVGQLQQQQQAGIVTDAAANAAAATAAAAAVGAATANKGGKGGEYDNNGNGGGDGYSLEDDDGGAAAAAGGGRVARPLNSSLDAAAAAVAGVQPAGNWTRFVVEGGQCPPISKELAASVARRHSAGGNGAVIVTWANFALWDFVRTWVYHAKDVGLSNFLVGAMDAAIGKELVAAGVPCFAMFGGGSNHSGVGADHLQWGGEAFHKMGRQKITLAQMFLGLGLDLLLVDVDAVLLGDVMDYMDRFPQADILVTSDQLASTIPAGDDGLEDPDKAQSPMNIGFMFFRHSSRTVQFVDSWLAAINADPKYWDQNAFNDLARQGWAEPGKGIKRHPDASSRVFLGANGTLAVGVLPVASFSGGHTFYVQRLYEVQRVKPYAVHCTFQYGANPGKRNRLREARLFHDLPEYYTDDTYVSVELRRVPSATWADHSAKNNSAMKRYHFRGLDMQLESVWPAVRVAAVTNRSLIVPKLACYCDKYWTELDKCRVPGAGQTRIPFLCPMDHVLDPIFMNDKISPQPWPLRWREHSFLDNPRCPDWVRQSRVTFISSPTATKPVEKWVVQEGGLVVVVPANLTQAGIKDLLKPYTQYKIWHLKDPELFFGGFDDKELEQKVEARINHLRPVMPPDPSPPPPPGTGNSTAPAAGGAAAGAGAGAGASATNATAAASTAGATATGGGASGAGVNATGGTAAAAGTDKNAGMLTAVHE